MCLLSIQYQHLSVFPKWSLLLGKLSAMGYLKEMLSVVYASLNTLTEDDTGAVSENTFEDPVGLKMMTRKFYRGTMSIQNSSNK